MTGTYDWLMLFELVLLPLLMAGSLAYLLSPIVLMIYQRLGWVDDPSDQRHEKVVHEYPVPRGGGLVIFGSIAMSSLLLLDLNAQIVGILAGALLLTIVGVLDDVLDVNPYLRLGLGLLAALCVVGVGIGIEYVTHPWLSGVIMLDQPVWRIDWGGLSFGWRILTDSLALVWILWCMNMVNWAKGLDGQLPGLVVIAGLVIAGLSLRFAADPHQWNVTILASLLAGAFAGFLPWNVFPQKMMPGYGAGTLAGYLLAVLSIVSGAKLATLALVLAIPMLDGIVVVVRRIWKGRSPVWGDRSHFHHLLLDMGWSKRLIAWFYWSVSLAMGLLTLQLQTREKLVTIVLAAAVFLVAVLWLRFLSTSSKA